MSIGDFCHTCTDANGDLKSTYESMYDAESTAVFISSTEGKTLRAYECPNHKGWHLTKSIY